MKDYSEVVENRFNSENKSNSIYDASHPVGKYSRKQIYGKLNRFLSFLDTRFAHRNKTILLDVGAGNGGMIDFFIDQGFQDSNITGFDMSTGRIDFAKLNRPSVHWICGDVLEMEIEKKFDLITSFDLFSHLTTREQIITGLQRVKEHLNEDGVFLWYDIYSKDHFSPNPNSDSWGFNLSQMIELAGCAGLVPVYQDQVFKLFFNKYHSLYQVQRLPAFVVNFLEGVIPGNPGNILVGFEQKKQG